MVAIQSGNMILILQRDGWNGRENDFFLYHEKNT